MQRSLTQQHLVTTLLGDLDPVEKIARLKLINANWELRESYKELKQGMASLPKVVLRPSQQVLDNVLRYSKTTMVEV